MKAIRLSSNETFSNKELIIQLSGSKSESNRALIIAELCTDKVLLSGLSNSDDTNKLLEILKNLNNSDTVDVGPAGTTLRFLLAYFFIKKQKKTLTGSSRMKERPIGLLAEALEILGAEISYSKKKGYPPISLTGFKTVSTNHLSIDASVSSQFISAILLIAPLLPNGVIINLDGKISSLSYIEMTLDIMSHFGIICQKTEKQIQIQPQVYQSKSFSVEPDWSSLSYWYSLIAISEFNEITFPGFRQTSKQGDRIIAEIMLQLGVRTLFEENGVRLLKSKKLVNLIELDFANCPDLAPTVIVCCAALGVNGIFTGLVSLRIKECDRITALENELKKFDVQFHENKSGKHELNTTGFKMNSEVIIETFQDHRIAMAFAPLVFTQKLVIIENPDVVSKSYPQFWEHLGLLNLDIKSIDIN